MTRAAMTNFDADVYDRLQPIPAQLTAACRLASQQLEFLKPAVMAVAQTGVYAGAAAHVHSGTILIVVADPKKVVTIHLVPSDAVDQTFVDSCARIAQPLLDLRPDEVPIAGQIGALLNVMVKDYGGQPGEHSPAIPTQITEGFVGLVFSLLPDNERGPIAEWIRNCQRADICPALVVVIGPARSGERDKLSIAISSLPLARYIDSIGRAP